MMFPPTSNIYQISYMNWNLLLKSSISIDPPKNQIALIQRDRITECGPFHAMYSAYFSGIELQNTQHEG